MPIWGWILIIVGLAVFIPFKVKMTKKFLERQKKREEDNIIDE